MGPLPPKKISTKPKLIFMGTPEFALPTLKALIDHGHDLRAVVTQPDRPKGRGRILAPPPVKKMAAEHGIEVLQPEKASDPLICDRLKKKDPDLIIVIAFGQILRPALLEVPKWGAVNIHASLLPEYRGAAPIQWAILNDEPRTGLTLMRMDEGLDTGPILFQTEIQIFSEETAGQLHDRLAELAGEMIIEALSAMAHGAIREQPQDKASATYAPKIERPDCVIDWKQQAGKVSALIRALDPKPGAVTRLGDKQIKLFTSRIIDDERIDVVPGRVVKNGGGALLVEAGRGVIEAREIQLPGKKRLSASEFLKGASMPEGVILGQ
jgi:methionyl-tRNA formyltransferase